MSRSLSAPTSNSRRPPRRSMTVRAALLGRAIEASRFTGAKSQTLSVLGQANFGRLILLGTGKPRDLDLRTAEALGGLVAAEANSAGLKAVTLVVDPIKGNRLPPAQVAAHIALGAQLRCYRFDKYKTKEQARAEADARAGDGGRRRPGRGPPRLCRARAGDRLRLLHPRSGERARQRALSRRVRPPRASSSPSSASRSRSWARPRCRSSA